MSSSGGLDPPAEPELRRFEPDHSVRTAPNGQVRAGGEIFSVFAAARGKIQRQDESISGPARRLLSEIAPYPSGEGTHQ